MFCVYILYSERIKKFYTGTTDNVERRLYEHNHLIDGIEAYTSRGRPWEVFFVIEGLSSRQAYGIESHIKRMNSSVYIRNLKQYPEMVLKLKALYG